MIKEKYKKRQVLAGRTIELHTDSAFRNGKRKGVLEIEDEVLIFREMIATVRKRSKSIARTTHFSVLERPDGTIAGTFHFRPEGKKLRGRLSAEFWQAITLAFDINDKTEDDEKSN